MGAMRRAIERQPRPEVRWYAEVMEYRLALNDHKGGWGHMPLDELMQDLRSEVDELADAVMLMRNAPRGASLERYRRHAELVALEAADVGNRAMMVADRAMKEAGWI